MDWRLLSLFFVLTIAVELGKASDLFDRLVAAVAARVRTARGLALGMVAVAGALAAILTNDVALLLVVPFTMRFRRVTDLDLAPLVVLEVAAANLHRMRQPAREPAEPLSLHARRLHGRLVLRGPGAVGRGRRRSARGGRPDPRPAPRARAARARRLRRGSAAGRRVRRSARRRGRGALRGVPLRASRSCWRSEAPLLLGRRVFDTDFSLVAVFAFLFVGIAGLERGRLYATLDPVRIFGHEARGLVLSGAFLSQWVSNVPAAMLLAPAAATAAGFRALLYGVNAGGCGTPISSLANLIGAQVFVREGGDPRAFWRRFLPVSFALLGLLVLVSLALVSVSR